MAILKEKMINIKPFGGSKLYSKASAQELRSVCYSYLRHTDDLVINMAGIKECSPGFAFEAFGILYVDAKKYNKKIRFKAVKKELKPILLHSVVSARNLLNSTTS